MNRIISAVLITGIITLAACSKNEGNTTGSGKTYVQVITASPQQAMCDKYRNDEAVSDLVGMYYGMATNYGAYTLENGTLSLRFKSLNYGEFINTGNLPVAEDNQYTFIFFDSVPGIKWLLIHDTISTTLSANKGALKFINASPNAGPVKYKLKNGPTLTSAVPYAGGSTPGYTTFIPVDTGWIDLQVLDANTNAVIDSVPMGYLRVLPGNHYTIYTTGYRGNTTYNYKLQSWTTIDEKKP